MSKVVVILNPAAGGGRASRRRQRVEVDLQRSGLDYRLVVTSSEAHLRSQVRHWSTGAAWLMVVGGDTSFRIAAAEVLEQRHGEKKSANLAFCGAGSANDVMRSLGIRSSRHLCELIRHNRVRHMDVGWVRTDSPAARHCFLGSMSLGLGVAVNREMARTHGASGKPVADWGPGLAALRRVFREKELPMELDVNGRTGRYSLAAVLNGSHYAGGLKPARGASPFNRRLELLLLSTHGWRETLAVGATLLAGRRLTVDAGLGWRLTAPQPFDIQIDGDVFPAGRGCSVEVQAAALPVAATGFKQEKGRLSAWMTGKIGGIR